MPSTFLYFCSYEDALSKLKQALKTESQVPSLLNKIRRQMCHCYLKVNVYCLFGSDSRNLIKSEKAMTMMMMLVTMAVVVAMVIIIVMMMMVMMMTASMITMTMTMTMTI